MRIFDLHCDTLMQLLLNQETSFENSPNLHNTYEQLQENGMKAQAFALYIPDDVHPDVRFEAALQMVDIFYGKILAAHSNVKLIKGKQELQNLTSHQWGALLTLEGCEAIGQDLTKLRTLLRLGVRSVGLTWNHANAVADGAKEPRGAGLSTFGYQVVNVLNETKTWCDVSHLCERAFWDCMEVAQFPIASHSNCAAIRPHARNLSDKQITALLKRQGVMGITFVPDFLTGEPVATIDDILRHVEHVCALGGEHQVGFGSDFDGITETVKGLSKAGEYPNLIDALLQRYSADQVDGFLYRNFANALPDPV